jgi:hypothetical protein
MASVQVSPPKLNPEQILEQMGQLALSDLEQVMNKGYYLLAEKKAPHLSKRETELFREINDSFDEVFWHRYKELREKLEDETMTPTENEEFLKMNEEVEAKNVIRLRSVAELAQLRQMSIPDLMSQLGLIKQHV